MDLKSRIINMQKKADGVVDPDIRTVGRALAASKRKGDLTSEQRQQRIRDYVTNTMPETLPTATQRYSTRSPEAVTRARDIYTRQQTPPLHQRVLDTTGSDIESEYRRAGRAVGRAGRETGRAVGRAGKATGGAARTGKDTLDNILGEGVRTAQAYPAVTKIMEKIIQAAQQRRTPEEGGKMTRHPSPGRDQ